MSINSRIDESYNPVSKFGRTINRFAVLSKKFLRFHPKLIIVTAFLFTLLNNVHIGYGSDGSFLHTIDGSKESVPDDYENGRTFMYIDSTTVFPDSLKTDFQVRAVLSGDNSGNNQANNLEDDNRSERKPFDYEVESGDTVSDIAERYGLKIDTILWANGLQDKSIIKPGQKLVLLPIDGVLHEVKKGEIIGKIATLHKADPQKTMDYNEITDPTKIYPGDMIIIPDGQPLPPPPKSRTAEIPKPPDGAGDNQSAESPAQNLTDKLLWPTPAKRITQGYWVKHRGIDIANGETPPIFASHDGTVEFAGKSGDWGNTILLRKSDGLVTRYSHASEIYVTIGQTVNTGDTIAKVGSTGNSTGNHLDFRVYINGVAANPLKLLQ